MESTHDNGTESYEPPRLVLSCSIGRLLAQAAVSMEYFSDRLLKHEVEAVERPLERLDELHAG